MKFYSIICFKLDKYHSKYNSYEITTERDRESARGQGGRGHLEEFIIFLLENISTFRAALISALLHSIPSIPLLAYLTMEPKHIMLV